MLYPGIHLNLPAWLTGFISDPDRRYTTVEDRMEFVIALARENVKQNTGGPFGAGIFDLEKHTLLAPGVNRVVPENCSVAHAEMIAIMIAQKRLGTFDLGGAVLPGYELVASTEPCAMCFGATPWSGVRQLVCGARDEDARRIGFDEGPKLKNWVESLEERGIRVIRDVCRDNARAVLEEYARNGGLVYNGRLSQ